MKVRVLKIIEYCGDIRWMRKQLANSLSGTKILKTSWGEATIKTALLDEVPEYIEEDSDGPDRNTNNEGRSDIVV